MCMPQLQRNSPPVTKHTSCIRAFPTTPHHQQKTRCLNSSPSLRSRRKPPHRTPNAHSDQPHTSSSPRTSSSPPPHRTPHHTTPRSLPAAKHSSPQKKCSRTFQNKSTPHTNARSSTAKLMKMNRTQSSKISVQTKYKYSSQQQSSKSVSMLQTQRAWSSNTPITSDSQNSTSCAEESAAVRSSHIAFLSTARTLRKQASSAGRHSARTQTA